MISFPKIKEAEYAAAIVRAYGKMLDDGSHSISETKNVTGYFEQQTKIITDEKGQNPISASLFIIYEDVPSLNSEDKGEITIYDRIYKIQNVARFFNFTNTVHHIELLVI